MTFNAFSRKSSMKNSFMEDVDKAYMLEQLKLNVPRNYIFKPNARREVYRAFDEGVDVGFNLGKIRVTPVNDEGRNIAFNRLQVGPLPAPPPNPHQFFVASNTELRRITKGLVKKRELTEAAIDNAIATNTSIKGLLFEKSREMDQPGFFTARF